MLNRKSNGYCDYPAIPQAYFGGSCSDLGGQRGDGYSCCLWTNPRDSCRTSSTVPHPTFVPE